MMGQRGLLAVLWLAGAAGAVGEAERPTARGSGFERTALGGTAEVEWAAFSGVVGHLDGPAREGMIRRIGGAGLYGCNNGVNSDVAGNLYICDMESGMIRALLRRDRMLMTLSGNGLITAGGTPGQQGPSYRLRINQDLHFAPVGDPLDGKGSLYFISDGIVLRLFRNELKDGKLTVAYDDAVACKAAGGVFDCWGIDGKGNFVGANGRVGGLNKIVVLAPTGRMRGHSMRPADAVGAFSRTRSASGGFSREATITPSTAPNPTAHGACSVSTDHGRRRGLSIVRPSNRPGMRSAGPLGPRSSMAVTPGGTRTGLCRSSWPPGWKRSKSSQS
jgi:hypothetical protein